MKRIVIICVLVFIPAFSFAQGKMKDTLKSATTTGVFDTAEAKSGYLINGYYVELTQEEFKKYKGKKVKVSGKLSIIKGLTAEEMKHEQGSSEDRKFIRQAKITVLK
jgi:hypothetical protein